ncbi:MAG: ATP-dependent DNA helicase RecG [Planctomycetota bacterium]|jgi:ATP-dependent DNA helicase RecG
MADTSTKATSTGGTAALGDPTRVLDGVGPARAAALARGGIERVGDLLRLVPVHLQEWPERTPLEELQLHEGERVVVRGRVALFRVRRLRGKASLARLRFEGFGADIEALFFNQPWVDKGVLTGDEVEVLGTVSLESGRVALRADSLGTKDNPLPAAGRLEPQYMRIAGVGPALISRMCQQVCAEHARTIVEPLPQAELDELELLPLPEAMQELHAPKSLQRFEAARRRMRLDEWLGLQASLLRAQGHSAGAPARIADVDAKTLALFQRSLPFELTASQQEVIGELRQDLGQTRPMRRLLQGDVGSGKTMIALYAAVAVARAGGQVALLAPTSLLAEQHAAGLEAALLSLGLRGCLITASLPAGVRRERARQVAAGEVHVVFGTHALMSDQLSFARLDLAVIDEQHRFGVSHRKALIDKGSGVHALLMTATPIPRTLALTLYGDLDVSVLRGMPPGRGKLVTKWVRGQARREIMGFLRERMTAGEQVYWVCPRVGDESDPEAGPTVSAESRFVALAKKPVAAFGIELVHGRLSSEERRERLDRFRSGESKLLVATTVIEVGVDVPAATVIVIEDSQRLGLAALHQLRGRVGRGRADSYCLLLGTKSAAKRLELLVQSRDGFFLADHDLRTRGMGELAGLRQSGVAALALEEQHEADLELLRAARDLIHADRALAELYSDAVSEIVP